MKAIRFFLSENFQFLVVNFSIYLNRRVFVIETKKKKKKKKNNQRKTKKKKKKKKKKKTTTTIAPLGSILAFILQPVSEGNKSNFERYLP